MKKVRKQWLSLALCVLMAMVTLMGGVGCGPKGEKVDKNKTQLYIATYGGGYGTAFLKDLEERFEQTYEKTSFETGKTGVQIFTVADKDKYTVNALKDKIEYETFEVFFASGDALDQFLDGNKVLDITDIVTKEIPGEGKSIADKLRPEMEEHHNRNGRYHSLPFVDGGTGLAYDIDVFEENDLYFEKGGSPSEYCNFVQQNNANPVTGTFTDYSFVGANGDKAAGPDGKYGTYDDGLPATLQEFDRLLVEMKDAGVDSIIWSGEYEANYTPFLPKAFATNHHGLDESNILRDAGGANGRETTIITGFKNGEPQTERKTIKLENIGDYTKQEGFYYGLKMFESIINSGTVASRTWTGETHVETQYSYLISNLDADEKPIAFLLDGCWWENEADSAGSFKECEKLFTKEYGARENRRFGYFPMPWANESYIGRKYTLSGGGGSLLVAADFPQEKMELLETFLQFALSEESLQRMTVNIGLPIPYVYDMGDKNDPNSYYNKMSSYTRNYYELYKQSDIVYGFVAPELIYNEALKNAKEVISYMTSIKADGTRYTTFPSAKHYDSSVTAEDFFLGLYRKYSAS